MRKRLTEADIKKLKYECRAGYAIPVAIAIIGILLTLGYSIVHKEVAAFTINENNQIVIGVIILVCLFIGYLMTRNYISDIRNGEKEFEFKRVTEKLLKVDVEAGSGMLSFKTARDMKEFNSYNVSIDNCLYRVDKEFFETCNKGDEVVFYTAPISKCLLGIEKKE